MATNSTADGGRRRIRRSDRWRPGVRGVRVYDLEVSVVQLVVLAFGVLMIGFSVLWLRFARRMQRSGDAIEANVRGVLVTRIGGYLMIGVCAVLLAITKSPWFGWVGVAALVARLVVEEYLHRRERSRAGADGLKR